MSTLTFGFIGLGLIGGSIAGRSVRISLSLRSLHTISMQIPCGGCPVWCCQRDHQHRCFLLRLRLSFPLCSGTENDENLSAVKKFSHQRPCSLMGSVKSEIHTEITKPVWKDSLSAVIPWREATGWALLIPKPSFWRMPTTYSLPQIPFLRIRSRIIKIWCNS